jgi:hypothetical protein
MSDCDWFVSQAYADGLNIPYTVADPCPKCGEADLVNRVGRYAFVKKVVLDFFGLFQFTKTVPVGVDWKRND